MSGYYVIINETFLLVFDQQTKLFKLQKVQKGSTKVIKHSLPKSIIQKRKLVIP